MLQCLHYLHMSLFVMVMQISCVTATPVLSDRKRFPKYFQFLPSMVDFAPAYFGIIKEFNWRHVVILLQDENLYTLVRSVFAEG